MTFFKALEELNKTILKKFPDNCMEYNSDDEKTTEICNDAKIKRK